MKVLLTGGTGFIGTRLRDELRSEGHDVRLLVRRESEHKVPSPNSFDIVYGDIFNTNACLRACDGRDAVINLVGIIREYPHKGITYDEYHRIATKNIVDAARRQGAGRFLQMSALGAREDAEASYQRSKYAGEEIVKDSPMRWTIFRPSIVFGPGNEELRRLFELVYKPVVPLINGGGTLLQPVAVEDVTACMTMALAMAETQGKTFELGGPDRISLKETLLGVAKVLGRKLKTVNVPLWSVRPVVRLMQRFAAFPVTADQLRMLLEDNVCEIDPYVKAFQVEPKSFVQALPALVG